MITRTIGLFVIAIFSSFESVIGQSAVEQPLTAIAKSTEWTEVFENAFDLEVTVHYGGTEGGTEGVARWETICKCRQIYDERGGLVFTPWAIGSVDVDPKQSPQASDSRQRRLRVVERESLYELNFLAKSEGKRVSCGKVLFGICL
jgi:hypothetical protein